MLPLGVFKGRSKYKIRQITKNHCILYSYSRTLTNFVTIASEIITQPTPTKKKEQKKKNFLFVHLLQAYNKKHSFHNNPDQSTKLFLGFSVEGMLEKKIHRYSLLIFHVLGFFPLFLPHFFVIIFLNPLT